MNTYHGRVGRALHHKMHGGFEARLEILGDLPEHARHGLFAAPKVYDALVRYSNGSSAVADDEKADVRGLAVKVFDVDGPKVLGTARTQDFLGILQSSTPFRSADEFVGIIYASRSPLLALPRMLFAGPADIHDRAGRCSRPSVNRSHRWPRVASTSALPIKCGPCAARFAFVPIAAFDPTAQQPAPIGSAKTSRPGAQRGDRVRLAVAILRR